MRKTTLVLAAFSLLAVAAPAANAQKLDANGRCHDAKGRFAKAEVCSGAAPVSSPKPPAAKTPAAKTTAVTTPATTSSPALTYKLDAKGKCRDSKGKMAKKDLCKA